MARRRHRCLVLLPTAVAALTALAAAPARATFPGPNGRIAFSDFNSGQISAVNPDGSGLKQLTHTGANRAADYPNWSPNGNRLLFSVFHTNTADDHSRIWIMRADGTHEHRLTDDVTGFRDYTPKFTPDGEQIIFSRCKPDDGVCAIWKMRADGTHKRALTPYVDGPSNEHIDFFPSADPDGKRIAFARFASNGIISKIYVMQAGGGNPHAISPARLEGFAPDWSPSGGRITFSSNSLRAGESVFTMKPDGSDVRRITPDRSPHSDALSAYSPQGDRIVFVSDRNFSDACCNDLFAINPGGGGEHLIDTGLSGAGILFSAWGPAPLLP